MNEAEKKLRDLEGQVGSYKEMREKIIEITGEEEEKKYYRPPITKKLTKQMVLDAIGKDHQSKEFVEITDILGEPEISVDEESNIVDFTWEDYGINVVILYEEGTVENFFFYPLAINKYGSCKQVCIFEEFDVELTLEEVIKKYGKPDRERADFLGYKIYYYCENYDMYFTFYDKNHIYSFLIGTSD